MRRKAWHGIAVLTGAIALMWVVADAFGGVSGIIEALSAERRGLERELADAKKKLPTGGGAAQVEMIGDLALTPEGSVDAVIIDVGGFLGIGEKPVAVAMDNLNFMRDGNGTLYLYTQFTEDQLENAPEYNSDTYAENRDTMRIENQGQMSGQSGSTDGTAEPTNN